MGSTGERMLRARACTQKGGTGAGFAKPELLRVTTTDRDVVGTTGQEMRKAILATKCTHAKKRPEVEKEPWALKRGGKKKGRSRSNPANTSSQKETQRAGRRGVPSGDQNQKTAQSPRTRPIPLISKKKRRRPQPEKENTERLGQARKGYEDKQDYRDDTKEAEKEERTASVTDRMGGQVHTLGQPAGKNGSEIWGSSFEVTAP